MTWINSVVHVFIRQSDTSNFWKHETWVDSKFVHKFTFQEKRDFKEMIGKTNTDLNNIPAQSFFVRLSAHLTP